MSGQDYNILAFGRGGVVPGGSRGKKGFLFGLILNSDDRR